MSDSEAIGRLLGRLLGAEYESVTLRHGDLRLASRSATPRPTSRAPAGDADVVRVTDVVPSPVPGWITLAVAEGAAVAMGDTVATVHTHAGSHPVEAPSDGVVVALLATDNQFIGFGSALFSIARAL